MKSSLAPLLVYFSVSGHVTCGLAPKISESSRREVFTTLATSVATWTGSVAFATGTVSPSIANAVDNEDSLPALDFRNRDRKMNKEALIREDYWYMMGKTPPRLLTGPLQGDDPQWNAFGTCVTSGGSNSCTYVSLNQRIPAYSKYGSSIQYGGRQYQKLGALLRNAGKNSNVDDTFWNEAANFVAVEAGTVPPPLVDAELKMILLATSLLTSPNFPIPSKELLVARYYSNEAHFASTKLQQAVREQDLAQAVLVWEYGRDAWNSYFQVVNRSISAKVGDQFELVA